LINTTNWLWGELNWQMIKFLAYTPV
jgi:hypothetical protein